MTRWLALLGAVLLAAPVYAITIDTADVVEKIIPTGNGVATSWVNDYAGVDDYPDHDTNTSYIYVTNSDAGTPLTESFTAYDMDEAGLVGIDSVGVMSWHMQTGTAACSFYPCLIENGDTLNGASVTWDTSNYAQNITIWDDDPKTTAEWTVDSVNALEFGVQRNVAPAFAKQGRVTQIQKWIYKRTRQAYDTTDRVAGGELEDAWIQAANPTYNYGGDSFLYVGYSAADAGVRRSMVFIYPVTFLAGFSHYKVDSAFLDMVVTTVDPGTHKVYAYASNGPAMHGDSIGAVDDSAVCWRDRIYAVDSVDKWQLGGCDSIWEEGGWDRSGEPLDSVTITTTGLKTWNVTSWAQGAIATRITNMSPSTAWHMSPIVLVQASEAAADSMVTFGAAENSIPDYRPYVRIYGTYKYGAGETPPVALTGDSLIFFGTRSAAAVVSTMNIRDSLGSFRKHSYGTRNDVTTGATFLVGMWKDNDYKNNNWANGEFMASLTRFRNIFAVLYDSCLCDDTADANLIDSVHLRYYVNGSRLPPFAGVKAKHSLLLQGYDDAAVLVSGYVADTAVSDSFIQNSGAKWGTHGARKRVSGADGDSIVDYEYLASGTATQDRSNDTANWTVNTTLPAVGEYFWVDVTNMFKQAVRARAKDTGKASGASLLDTVGFAIRTSFVRDTTADSLTGVELTRSFFAWYGAGISVDAYAPALRIGYASGINPHTRCAYENPPEGNAQVIIIGAREEQGPPRYHEMELRER